MALFRRFIVRGLARDPGRALVTVAGLTLGVAVVVAIRLANTASVRGFEAALDVVSGKTSLEIVGAGVGVPERQLEGMGWLRDYGRVSPIIDQAVSIAVPNGTERPLRVLGVDLLRDRPFREYQLLRFSREGRDPRPQELLGVLLDSTSVVLTERFARRHGIDVDAPVTLIAGDIRHAMVVQGLLLDEGPAQVVDGQLALLDIATAQWLFDRLGWVDRVEIQLFDAAAIDASEQEIAARLPAGLRVQRPAQRGREVEKMLAAFHFNLNALSYIALIVGLFLVYNTVAVAVIARRTEIGTLRALGATRRAVLGLFLGEAALLAAVGAALGAPAGWLLARAAVRLTSSTVNTLYVTSQATVPALGATDLLLAGAVAVPLALIRGGHSVHGGGPHHAGRRRARRGRHRGRPAVSVARRTAGRGAVRGGRLVLDAGCGRRPAGVRPVRGAGRPVRHGRLRAGAAGSAPPAGALSACALAAGRGPAGAREPLGGGLAAGGFRGGPGRQPGDAGGGRHHGRQLPGHRGVLGRTDPAGRPLRIRRRARAGRRGQPGGSSPKLRNSGWRRTRRSLPSTAFARSICRTGRTATWSCWAPAASR